MREPLKVGVVGAGTIGRVICEAIDQGDIEARLVGLCDVDEAKRDALLKSLHQEVAALALDDLCAASDVVVEAAAMAVAPTVVEAALKHDCDVVVMSVGGLLGRTDLVDLAWERSRRIHVPTGAIAGLDAIRAAKAAGLDSVRLTTTKPPRGLAGAPYLVDNRIDVTAFTEPTTVFEGTAAEAVRAFPANVNVAAALSLAGIGPDETEVRVVVDPTSDRNRHEIEVVGAFGRLLVAVDNLPSPTNPKTSYLAALSAVAVLRRMTTPLVVGA